MGSIVSSGVGSGLDVAGLVKKLVEAEGGPKTLRLNAEEAKVQAKLSALGTLRSALAAFADTASVLKDPTKFQGRQVSLSSEDFVSASATSTAMPGAYDVEVRQLAGAHKLQSTTFASASTVVGTGTLHVSVAGETYDVVIDSSNNTLEKIAAAINDSEAGEKLAATVIQGAGDARLTITSRTTGAAGAIAITQTGALDALVYPPAGSGLTQLDAAADALALIDGVEVTSATNSISGAIPGVTISLLAQNALDETTKVTVGFDQSSARKSVDDFVKSYNALVDAIKSVSGFNTETKQSGPLFGDAGLRNIVDQLRRELTSPITGLDGPFDMLNEIGITMQLDGKLSVDGARLDAAFATSFDAIGELFGGAEHGLATKMDALLDPYLEASGIFDSRTTSLKSTIDDINDRREALSERLLALQERYTRQFNALDGLLAQMQSTSNFLAQQLNQLPGAVFKND